MKSLSTNGAAGSTPTRGYLGHQLPSWERLNLAVRDYVEGRPIARPTMGQLAYAYRVSLTEFRLALRDHQQAHNGHNGAEPSTLADHLTSTPPTELSAALTELARIVGSERMLAAAIAVETSARNGG